MGTRITRSPWLGFSVALAAALMDLLDSTIASIGAPAIRTSLHGSYADLQWIAAAYTLAMAVGLLTGGRLGDLFGRRRMLLIGAAGFAVASLACALAPTAEALIAFRAVQGGIGALMVPQTFGLIRDLFGPADMGKGFAVLGPVCGLAAVAGPVLGGLLIHLDLLGTGWRAIFLVNLPVAAFVLLGGRAWLPAGGAAGRRRLDTGGMALAGAGMFGLVFPLVQGRELGWPAWVLLMPAAAAAVLAGFGRAQRRRNRRGRTTLVETGIFANRSYVAGVAFALVFVCAMGGIGLVLGVLMQVGLGYSPMHASLASAPFALGGFAGSAAGGIFAPRAGRAILHGGLAVMAAGLLALVSVLADAGTNLSAWDFTAPLLLAGAGMGAVFVPMFDIVLGGVAAHEIGSASGVLQAIQQLGISLGVAVLGTAYFELLGPGRRADFVHAAQLTTLGCAGLCALAFVIAFGLPRGARGAAAAAAPAPA